MLSLPIVKKELREHRWVLLVGTVVLAAMGIFTAWSHEMLQSYEGMLREFFSPNMMDQFEPMLSNYSYYLWSQWHPKNLLQVGTILALVLAAPAIAGEVNRGSIKYLTSLPLSRRTILLSKVLAGIISLTVIIWTGTLILLLAGSVFGPSLEWGKILAATFLTNFGLIAVYAVGLSFSAWGSDAVKTGAIAAAALFVWSATGLHSVTSILSPFWHMKGIPWFLGLENYPWLSLSLLALLTLAALFLADRLFSKRHF